MIYSRAMTKPKPDQLAKFKQAAGELGTDDSEKHFNEKLDKIARSKPTVEPKPKKEPGK
jgi:hypothetical protein